MSAKPAEGPAAEQVESKVAKQAEGPAAEPAKIKVGKPADGSAAGQAERKVGKPADGSAAEQANAMGPQLNWQKGRWFSRQELLKIGKSVKVQ